MGQEAKSFLTNLKTMLQSFIGSLEKQHQNLLDRIYLDNIGSESFIKLNVNDDYSKLDFKKLHCVETNTSETKIISNGGDDVTIFPPGSFVKGAMYTINLDKIVSHGGVIFIGYL